MRRIYSHKRIKSGMTLVELVVAMALTAIFGAACIVLVLPVERIYTRTTDVSRAQLLADTIVDSLRTECANTYIQGKDDIWICDSGDSLYDADSLPSGIPEGHVLVIRKNPGYCQTLYSNGQVPQAVYDTFTSYTGEDAMKNGDVTSRAILRMFNVKDGNTVASPDTETGYVHFGYFVCGGGNDKIVYPTEYYDFTNPVPYAAYREYTVDMTFSELTPENDCHSSVMCRIDILKGGEIVYTRNTVLCFAGKVQE